MDLTGSRWPPAASVNSKRQHSIKVCNNAIVNSAVAYLLVVDRLPDINFIVYVYHRRQNEMISELMILEKNNSQHEIAAISSTNNSLRRTVMSMRIT